MLLISIIESIYIIYMFNYFKTRTYLSHPMDVFTNKVKFIDHSNKDNHICPLGNIAGYILAVWFILRNIVHLNNIKKYNLAIISIVLITCLLTNMNAFIYFLPVFIIEIICNKIF